MDADRYPAFFDRDTTKPISAATMRRIMMAADLESDAECVEESAMPDSFAIANRMRAAAILLRRSAPTDL
jgi:hypothetical protein